MKRFLLRNSVNCYLDFSILRHGEIKTSLQYELCISLIAQARDTKI